MLRINSSQDDIGVGDSGLDAACAVARGPGFSAGAPRPDAQHAASVDPGDRAAARADRANVEHRDLDRQAPFDLEGGGEALLLVEDRGDIGRGAAHVEGHEVVDAAELGEVAARDHAAGRPRHGQIDGGARGRFERHLAAVRLDHHGRRAHARLVEPFPH